MSDLEIIKTIRDLAMARRDMWFRRFSFTPTEGVHMIPPDVEFLVSRRTWSEYHMAMLRSWPHPPEERELWGIPVLLTDDMKDGDVRLVLV